MGSQKGVVGSLWMEPAVVPVFHLQGCSAQETVAHQSQGLFLQEGNKPEGNPCPRTCLTFSGRSPPLSELSSVT